ncbi:MULTISPECIES: hypothetical protein [unclassified Streptomyces]|uniref:hypothetical protein n=1 Tax=unclassified Streptomyces TaxID=2593676 RepID=UPI0005ED1DB6|nr:MULTISPECIES: hypothetical protein [unclassified Streptomyces]APU39944.1 hypothetical protein BSL84_09310 [Streptomyces sp. TN58]KJK46437.1 hypothetical protein UK14_23275 [Streptomyces sp. NRRL F-4428]
MDIPSAVRWFLLAVAAVQLVHAVRALRPALRAAPGERVDAWLAFADPAVGAPVSVALAADHLTAFLCGMAVSGPVLAWQLIRSARASAANGRTPAATPGPVCGPL